MEYVDTVYSQCRPNQLAWNDSTKLGQLISSMARMHSVNCQNHVVTNIVKWIRKWVIWKLGKHLRHFLSTDHFNDVVSFTMREVTRNDDEEEDHFLPERVINAVTIQQLELMFDCIEHYLNKLKDILEEQPLDEDSLKASWWTYLKP
ncbi:hypothetical protein MP638_003680, partial [Amoeboaphelidium occidentale]